MVLRRSFLALLLGAGFCTSAHASAILFSTLGTGLGSGSEIAKAVPSTSVAESFIATGGGIGDLELALSAPSGSTGSIVITVMNDSGDRPQTIVDTIATVMESQIGSSEGFYDFFNLPISNLTAGNRYWIDIAKSASAQTSFYTTTATNPLSFGTDSNSLAAGSTNYFPGVRSGTGSPLAVMCVSSDNSCDTTYPSTALSINVAVAAPEPTAMAILGTGLVALGWSRRRS